MNCPNCGKEMESGFLLTHGARGTPPTWAESGPGWILSPKGKIRLEPPGGDTIASVMTPTYPGTHICKTCKTVVFQYE